MSLIKKPSTGVEKGFGMAQASEKTRGVCLTRRWWHCLGGLADPEIWYQEETQSPV